MDTSAERSTCNSKAIIVKKMLSLEREIIKNWLIKNNVTSGKAAYIAQEMSQRTVNEIFRSRKETEKKLQEFLVPIRKAEQIAELITTKEKLIIALVKTKGIPEQLAKQIVGRASNFVIYEADAKFDEVVGRFARIANERTQMELEKKKQEFSTGKCAKKKKYY
jgi:hypothetical protein